MSAAAEQERGRCSFDPDRPIHYYVTRGHTTFPLRFDRNLAALQRARRSRADRARSEQPAAAGECASARCADRNAAVSCKPCGARAWTDRARAHAGTERNRISRDRSHGGLFVDTGFAG